jgi:hypothetical protein
MYRINMLHYISISQFLREIISRVILGKIYLSFNRGEDFIEINQSETRIACGGHV